MNRISYTLECQLKIFQYSQADLKKKKKRGPKRLFEWPKCRTLATLNAGEDVEQQELSFTAGGKWCSHFGRQFGSFLQN